jgi:hypothetical protein
MVVVFKFAGTFTTIGDEVRIGNCTSKDKCIPNFQQDAATAYFIGEMQNFLKYFPGDALDVGTNRTVVFCNDIGGRPLKMAIVPKNIAAKLLVIYTMYIEWCIFWCQQSL